MNNKEEFMKANGFIQDEESMAWVNRTDRVWLSNQAVANRSLSELFEKISIVVPRAEFHFYSNQAIPDPTCVAILKRLNLPDLKPVNRVWLEGE